MRLVFEVDYTIDEGEDLNETTRLITEELAGWEGVSWVRSRLWDEVDQSFSILQEMKWETEAEG